MTTKSHASSVNYIPREDTDVYQYALRVAYLTHVLSSSPSSSLASTAAGTGHNAAIIHKASHGAGLSNTTTVSAKSMTNGTTVKSSSSSSGFRDTLSAMFRDSDATGSMSTSTLSLPSFSTSLSSSSSSSNSSGRVKFPKEFLKVFEQRLVRISQGQDLNHNDQLFRATVGAFYGVYKDKTFQQKLLDTRQIEQLILRYASVASDVLKKRVPGQEWKPLWDASVAEFAQLVRDALKGIRGVSSELLQRLETYYAATPPTTVAASRPSLGDHDRASTSQHTLDGSSSVTSLTSVRDMPQVLAVGRLFARSEVELSSDVSAIKRICTEQAAFLDLKTCINNIAQGGSRFPARREDFDSDDAFATWKKQEADQLQELLLEMTRRNPELLRSAGPSDLSSSVNGGSVGAGASLNKRMSVMTLQPPSPEGSTYGSSGDEDTLVDPSLVFVPPDPKFYFRRLYEIALQFDYEAMKDLPPDQDVSLTILSEINEQLLESCAIRWRIMAPLKAGTFLALIGQHYKFQGVPEACVAEALGGIERTAESWEYWRWPWAERQHVFTTMSMVFDNLLSRFFEIFQGIVDLAFDEVVDLLETIYSNEIFREDARDLAITFQELQQGMRKFVAMAYEEKQIEVDSMPRPHDLYPFLVMLDWIAAEAKGYDRQFPRKLMDSIDPPAIFLSIAGPWFVQHLDASRDALLAAASGSDGAASDDDLLELYRGTINLQKMHNAFRPDDPLEIDFSAWFEPYVRRWIATTEAKTRQWVQAAIQHDKFEPEGEDSHSSSIVDLIDSCKSATDFIVKLKWPNEFENAKYLTALSKAIARSIELYATQLEDMFIAEMFPRHSQGQIDKDVARPSAWLTKAKLAVQGDKKVEPFVFRPESCVKLNNIQAARKLLDTLYSSLDADKISRIVEINSSPAAQVEVPQQMRYLFTIKVVLAENLIPPEGSARYKKLDPFLTMSDPSGYRMAKTRTLYETNDPRWDETFDISVKGDLWLRANVYNRNLVEHHDNVGCAYIHLDPKKFSDFLPKDLWFQLEDLKRKPLDSRLSIRISMEGEKDDIQFYFGRAFRFLKRAENDMVRTMVDKMSPFVRHYISHSTLKALVKTSYNFDIDLDKVKGDVVKVGGKLNAYVRDAISGPSHTIPPAPEWDEHGNVVTPNSPSVGSGVSTMNDKKKGRAALTDLQIEDAIGDLFDYFNETFGTLKENLSQDAWELVIGRLWKEILATVESLIVPPLSDRPTDMKMLSDREVDIVFKWLGFLVNFFHGGGEGVPLGDLRNAKYRELVEARMYYDWTTDQLMEESVRTMQRKMQSLSRSDSMTGLGRSKSVYQQRNLGTIRARKIEKKQNAETSGEMILRVLRMHRGTQDFLNQQLMTLHQLHAEQAKKEVQRTSLGSLQRRTNGGRPSLVGSRGSYRNRIVSDGAVPPVPTLPSMPEM
ncbi:hypothetical protein OIO90_004391 [Microbotryomycetes sp. JL221]|nr:hypothetical protein OIO90_004391 [Microbotryomycetes sp. JL221]